MASTERDDEGFPRCDQSTEMTTYRDEYGVLYVCERIEGLGYGWRSMGLPADEPPKEA